MINKLYLKILLMIIVFISTFSFCLVTSNAMDSIITSADEFLGKGTNETLNFGQIKIVSDNLYNLFFIVGVAATVLVGMIIGIKFMVESAEEKAKLKEALVPYIVGCVIIYGAFGIWKVAINIGKSLSEAISSETYETVDEYNEEFASIMGTSSLEAYIANYMVEGVQFYGAAIDLYYREVCGSDAEKFKEELGKYPISTLKNWKQEWAYEGAEDGVELPEAYRILKLFVIENES
ncbi:MAG: hypothetical protein IKT41_03780 [Clostridia bacterium]|nr:hypothetical protein [Clostridia bacterium]